MIAPGPAPAPGNIIPHKSNGQLHVEPTAGQQAEALTGRDYLSYSQVTMYQSCKLKFWFTYVQGLKPEMISAAMLLGSCIHGVLEEHYQRLLSAEEPESLNQMMETFYKIWKREAGEIPIQFPRDETYAEMESTAKRMIEQFLQSPYANPRGTILGLEEPIRFQLSEHLPDLLARVDLIEQIGSELVITDFKTARSMWSCETAQEHAEQLVLYGAAAQSMARELDLKLKLRFVVITKAKSPRIESLPIAADPDRVQRSRVVFQRVFEDMQTGIVYPTPTVMNCSGCPHQQRCKTWHHET